MNSFWNIILLPPSDNIVLLGINLKSEKTKKKREFHLILINVLTMIIAVLTLYDLKLNKLKLPY